MLKTGLRVALDHVKYDAGFKDPACIGDCWRKAQRILIQQVGAPRELWQERVAAIFSGRPVPVALSVQDTDGNELLAQPGANPLGDYGVWITQQNQKRAGRWMTEPDSHRSWFGSKAMAEELARRLRAQTGYDCAPRPRASSRVPQDPHAYALDSTRCLVMEDERQGGGWCRWVAEDLRQALACALTNIKALGESIGTTAHEDPARLRDLHEAVTEAIAALGRVEDHCKILNREVE